MLNIIQLRKELVGAKMPGEQADVIVDALQKNRDDFSSHHATKEQLDTVEMKLTGKIEQVRTELLGEIKTTRSDLMGEIKTINGRLTMLMWMIPVGIAAIGLFIKFV